jgi:membrane associated rhomboid family serine protease
MIPVKHDVPRKAFPFVTLSLCACCVALFFGGSRFLAEQGFVPLDFIYALFHPLEGLRTATVMLLLSFFMHGSIMHLVGNLWYLWLFGPAIEQRLGALTFALLYGVAGVIATIVQAVSSPLSTIPIVGASGAIAGIMGLTLVLLPRSRLVCFFPPLFFFKIPSFVFLLLWFGIQYINLSYAAPQGALVAWWAHIGGFAFGVVAGVLLRIVAGKERRTKKIA